MSLDILKATKIGNQTVPGFWRQILPKDVFESSIPKLEAVDCRSCTGAKDYNYDPKTKCCTYYPSVPNFLIGFSLMRQLGSDAPTKMREMMELGFLLPSGLVSSPNRQLQTMKSSQKHDFGNYVDVVCDHLKENGDCGIYEHRNSVCSTWFCSFGTNKYAGDWWTKLRDLVAHSEQSLCQWSMGKVGLDMEQFRKTFDEFSLDIESMGNKSNGAWSSEFLKEVWQGYDPAEFFKLCAKEIVEHQGQLSKIVSQTSLLIPKTYHKNITQWLTRQATDQSYQKVNADVQYEGVEQLLRQIREIQDSVLLEEELEALRN